MKPSHLLTALLAALAGLATTAPAQDKPTVIRFGVPGVGVGGRPITGGSWAAYAFNKGLFEEEFRKDGIKATFNYFNGAGPALNEAYANGLLDVGFLGDLPTIVGRASGLNYKIVLASSRNSAAAIAVPTDSRIKSVEELRGKRVAIFKGTATQLVAARTLAAHGLSEKDLRVVSLNGVAQDAALASKDIDAIVTSTAGGLRWEDQGIGKVIYRGDKDPAAIAGRIGSNGSVQVSETFIGKYPQIVQRIVNVLLKAAALEANPANLDAFFKEWSKSGTPYSIWKRDALGKDYARLQSPLIDNEFVQIYKTQSEETFRLKLIRKPLNVNELFEPRFMNQGIKELKLESLWKAY